LRQFHQSRQSRQQLRLRQFHQSRQSRQQLRLRQFHQSRQQLRLRQFHQSRQSRQQLLSRRLDPRVLRKVQSRRLHQRVQQLQSRLCFRYQLLQSDPRYQLLQSDPRYQLLQSLQHPPLQSRQSRQRYLFDHGIHAGHAGLPDQKIQVSVLGNIRNTDNIQNNIHFQIHFRIFLDNFFPFRLLKIFSNFESSSS
jgi:hypothetical protein